MKLKSHKGASKRVRKTGSGKFTYQKASKRHLLTHKSKRQKKLDRTRIIVHGTDLIRIQRLLPN